MWECGLCCQLLVVSTSAAARSISEALVEEVLMKWMDVANGYIDVYGKTASKDQVKFSELNSDFSN